MLHIFHGMIAVTTYGHVSLYDKSIDFKLKKHSAF